LGVKLDQALVYKSKREKTACHLFTLYDKLEKKRNEKGVFHQQVHCLLPFDFLFTVH
jgi:hypothetical protein